MWWDAHCHLSFYLEKDLTRVFSEGALLGLGTWVQGGYGLSDWVRQQQIAEQYRGKIRTAFGLHPWALAALDPAARETQWKQLITLADQAHLIGETGLDYFKSKAPEVLAVQDDFFRRHLVLASDLGKPLVLHIVQGHGPALAILGASGRPLRGIVHAFSGSPEVAESYIRLGFLLSIGPGLLKKGYKQLKQTVASVGIQHLVLESDSPQDTHSPMVEPTLVPQVARAVADIKGLTAETVLAASTENLLKLGL